MKRNHKILAFSLVALMVAGTASAFISFNEGPKVKESLSGEVDASNVELGQSHITEQKATEKNHQGLVEAEPIPKMEDSLERENLIRRYRTLNDQNEIFHVYLMSHGKVVSYFTAQGKVSSVNSKLTQPQQFVPCSAGGDADSYRSKDRDCIVDSPQLDGSYGTNGDAVFFFTTDGSYVEWNGEYVVSERPLSIQTPLSLEADVNVTQ